MKRLADIKRRVPVIDVITAGLGDTVEWSIHVNENTEFEILFPPGKDPLVPGSNISTGHKLAREIAKSAAKGKYQYRIRLIRTNEDVEGPPKGKDVSGPEMIIV